MTWNGAASQVVVSAKSGQVLGRRVSSSTVHYSRTCGEPEEVIKVEKCDTLARVHVRLESGRDVLQAGKRQAFCHAQIVLVGMTAHTARSGPKVRLVALFVSAMGRKAPDRPNEPERGEGRQPVKPRARIGLQIPRIAQRDEGEPVSSLGAFRLKIWYNERHRREK